jgi:hypothetical protein
MTEIKRNTRASLIKALSYCSLRELPEPDNGEDVWIKALALVTKSDGSDYFVNIVKDADTLENKVKKDFGPTGAITKYKEFYPYLYLSPEYMPKLSDKSKDAKIEYLSRVYPNRDWSKFTVKELQNAIIGSAITMQLNQINYNINYNFVDDNGEGEFEEETGGNKGEDKE